MKPVQFQPSLLSNPGAYDSKEGNIAALGAVRTLVTGNRVIKTFQGVLSVASTVIYEASVKYDRAQNWSNTPTSVFGVNTKAAIAFYLLALLADANSNFRSYAITTAEAFGVKARTEAESDPEQIAAKAKAVGSDIAAAYARSLISPGVSHEEVSRWARYFSSIFEYSFNEEMIRLEQERTFGTNVQYAIEETKSGLHQAVDAANQARDTGRTLAFSALVLPFVPSIVTAMGAVSILGFIVYRRKNRKNRKNKKKSQEVYDD